MKKLKAIFILLFVASISIYAQNYDDPQNIDLQYNRDAEYPGGMNKFITDLWNSMSYTQEAIDARVDGTITISFDVEANGEVSKVDVIGGLGMGIDEEVANVIKAMTFTPALVEGKAVKMNLMFTVPIRVGPNSRLKK
ncbi:MAG: energy transducer TonB [Bacteroidota bacterium]|jgi:TonB family protein|nr:TonB family protein [Bacteroidales bacterium]MDI9534789.1 energy transducer TonB [Bacteroidota bacterium]NLP20257.1 energy transducer TonB [Bacteroidales bacterium]HNY44958.1 energy transducer TonB [Bacteroidales bacterium]HOD87442.1 energy transducer TonB [Bacteroidales bacterium]